MRDTLLDDQEHHQETDHLLHPPVAVADEVGLPEDENLMPLMDNLVLPVPLETSGDMDVVGPEACPGLVGVGPGDLGDNDNAVVGEGALQGTGSVTASDGACVDVEGTLSSGGAPGFVAAVVSVNDGVIDGVPDGAVPKSEHAEKTEG